MIKKRSKKFKISVSQRMTQAYFAFLTAMIVPGTAFAQTTAGLSSWFVNIGKEFATIVPIIVVILGSVGVVMAGFGIISAVMAKKNQRPLEHQAWLIIGGVLCVLLVPFVIAIGDSLSGASSEKAVEGFLD